jgi:serine/threonine-protein kinase
MPLRRRQRLGQFRIESRLGTGGFADVYKAYDTVEGIRVALKVPHENQIGSTAVAQFRTEVRLVAKLDHPGILPIKTAGTIDGRFVIVTPLATESLGDRMGRRIARSTVLDYAEQLLDALAYAHRRRVVHCDVKPENLLLFPENRLRLADFGLARVAFRTLQASGSGTVGYLAPEQALGKPSLRSDVFSAGLVLWHLSSGKLPEWPFEWPYPGLERLERGWSKEWIAMLRKAITVDERKRHADAGQMLRALRRAKKRALL